MTEAGLAAIAACPFELMKFTLTYDGELRSSGNSPKPEDKWHIRRALHPQLAELWQMHAVLSPLLTRGIWVPSEGTYWRLEQHHSLPEPPPPPNPGQTLINLIATQPVGGSNFLPLVRESLALICALDILFLRKKEPGQLIKQGGDIDNRLKTLFDGLRMPTDDEMRHAGGDPIPDPCFCLLENDSLIADVGVRTGRLLTKPGSSVFEVRLVIDVSVKAVHVRGYNLPLLGD